MRWCAFVAAAAFVAACGGSTVNGAMVGGPCTKSVDCQSSLCLPQPQATGNVCTRSCTTATDCPSNWTCAVSPALASGLVCQPASTVTVLVPRGARDKVDLLFMIDDSPSMAPKQAELKQRFVQFVQVIQDIGQVTPADYHVGVITSDVGAGPTIINSGQCHPGGDGGKLQAAPNPNDTLTPPVCAGFQLGGGASFIEFNQLMPDASGKPTTNLPSGFDLPGGFACIASVGTGGCGFEHQLESAFLALHNPPPENAGFLRDDAVLAVVFLSDEDDCSAPPDSTLFEVDTTTFHTRLSYRCSDFGIACAQTSGGALALMPFGDSGGPLFDCVPATAAMGGMLFDVARYTDLFTKPKSQGGAKIDPADVVLASFTAPEAPVASMLALIGPGAGQSPYQACAGPPDGSTCDVVLQHSCISPVSPTTLFGDPAVRIRAVVNAGAGASTSICADDYSGGLNDIARRIGDRLAGGGCLPTPPTDPPACTVVDITDDRASSTAIPHCDATSGTPCWRIDAVVASCTSGFRVVVDRGSTTPPAGTHTEATCQLVQH
jgi:hypothetical protein